jgi:hypothetical protein
MSPLRPRSKESCGDLYGRRSAASPGRLKRRVRKGRSQRKSAEVAKKKTRPILAAIVRSAAHLSSFRTVTSVP